MPGFGFGYGYGSTRRHMNLPAQPKGFEPTFNLVNLTYSADERSVTRTDAAGRRAVRGRVGHVTGKHYVELEAVLTRLRFAGVVDNTFSQSGAGGAPGANRCGIQAAELVAYPGITVPLGIFADPGVVVRLAWDAGADRYWLALAGGDWNDDPAAVPETGLGGLSTGGLVGPGYVGATLRPVLGAGVKYRLPGDPGYALPAGFTEWAG